MNFQNVMTIIVDMRCRDKLIWSFSKVHRKLFLLNQLIWEFPEELIVVHILLPNVFCPYIFLLRQIKHISSVFTFAHVLKISCFVCLFSCIQISE